MDSLHERTRLPDLHLAGRRGPTERAEGHARAEKLSEHTGRATRRTHRHGEQGHLGNAGIALGCLHDAQGIGGIRRHDGELADARAQAFHACEQRFQFALFGGFLEIVMGDHGDGPRFADESAHAGNSLVAEAYFHIHHIDAPDGCHRTDQALVGIGGKRFLAPLVLRAEGHQQQGSLEVPRKTGA